MTCTEQLIYEMHDPTAYITPDCVLDITGVRLTQAGADRVRVSGTRAQPAHRRPTRSRSAMSMARSAKARCPMPASTPSRAPAGRRDRRERLKMHGFSYDDFRVDLIGMSSLHGQAEIRPEPYEVRLRVAGRTHDRKAAHAVGFEVRALHMNGPGGAGGGMRPEGARGAGGQVGAVARTHGEPANAGGGRAMSVRVYDLAHCRAGDKGNTSNISVICYDAAHWEFLERS